MKRCSKCGEAKPLDQFHNGKTKDGLRYWCKSCDKASNEKWRKAHPEEKAAIEKAWYVANHEHATEVRRAWSAANRTRKNRLNAKWLRRHPDRRIAYKAVNYTVKSGRFPPVNTMVCEVCDEALACAWHHHNGYDAEYRLDVIAVCKECHIKEHELTL